MSACNGSQRLFINKRLTEVSLLIVVGIAIFMIMFYQDYLSGLQSERKQQTRQLSTVALGVVEYFHSLEMTGELSRNQAKKFAMKSIESATYDNNGYFWIIDSHGVLLMQPFTPNKVGLDFINWTDIHHKFIFKEFIQVAKQGGGWVDYYWPKPKSTYPYPKISYVRYFEPWDWILGTGVYLDDMKAQAYENVARTSNILVVEFIIFIITAFVFVNYYLKKLGELSIRDPLTNLYSKRFLNEIESSILRKYSRLSNQVLAVTFVDIDFFKKINDSYGHNCGDIVLQKIAELLVSSTRADDYCIRYGGEEFVIVGYYENEQATFEAIERIRNSVSLLKFQLNHAEFSLTLSAGIAFYNGVMETFEETILRADKLLYRSKQLGRNQTSM